LRGQFEPHLYDGKGQRHDAAPENCVQDEDKELQMLLERNLNLLPGDQISPGQDLRWLLVKREMPVVNPSSGENLWSIDFLTVEVTIDFLSG
jgi:hypothetical protein